MEQTRRQQQHASASRHDGGTSRTGNAGSQRKNDGSRHSQGSETAAVSSSAHKLMSLTAACLLCALFATHAQAAPNEPQVPMLPMADMAGKPSPASPSGPAGSFQDTSPQPVPQAQREATPRASQSPLEAAICSRLAAGDPQTVASFAPDSGLPGKRLTSRMQPSRWGRPHKGTDYGYGRNECIYAMADGYISALGRDPGNGPRSRGTYVEITYTAGALQGCRQRFFHMNAVFPPLAAKSDAGVLSLCPRGLRVFRGQALGTVGNTGHTVGRNGGYHAHVELQLPDGSLADISRIMDAAWTSAQPSDYFLIYQNLGYNETPERIRKVITEARRVPGGVEDILRNAPASLREQIRQASRPDRRP